MTGADFRRIALTMPEAVEGAHFGNPDFRVAGKIFATLALEKEGFGVLLLSPEQQAGMVEDAPELFSPVPGGWGGGTPPSLPPPAGGGGPGGAPPGGPPPGPPPPPGAPPRPPAGKRGPP